MGRRSITRERGTFAVIGEPHYEEVPAHLAAEVVAAYKKAHPSGEH